MPRLNAIVNGCVQEGKHVLLLNNDVSQKKQYLPRLSS